MKHATTKFYSLLVILTIGLCIISCIPTATAYRRARHQPHYTQSITHYDCSTSLDLITQWQEYVKRFHSHKTYKKFIHDQRNQKKIRELAYQLTEEYTKLNSYIHQFRSSFSQKRRDYFYYLQELLFKASLDCRKMLDTFSHKHLTPHDYQERQNHQHVYSDIDLEMLSRLFSKKLTITTSRIQTVLKTR